MHVKIEKGAAWLGLAMIGVVGILLVLVAPILPPVAPSDDAAAIVSFYTEHNLRIRVAMAFTIFLAFLFAPYFSLLSRQVRRVEGYWGVLSLTQIMVGITFPFGLVIVATCAATAAYRPERDPDVTQALNDYFWLMFVGFIGPLIVQAVILGVAAFIDTREVPSFPRWFGYFNIWFAVLLVPGGAIYLFKTGPLAWNGLFALYIPLSVFGLWIVVTTVVLLKAVDVEAAERERHALDRTWEPAA